MRTLIREGKVVAVHDVSDGGMLVAIAEMALAGGMGVQLFPYEGKLPAHASGVYRFRSVIFQRWGDVQ